MHNNTNLMFLIILSVQYQHSVQDEFLSVGESKVPVKTIREILSKADSKQVIV